MSEPKDEKNDWARTFDVNGQQVLVYHAYDSDEDQFIIHIMFHMDDAIADVKLCYREAITSKDWQTVATQDYVAKLVARLGEFGPATESANG